MRFIVAVVVVVLCNASCSWVVMQHNDHTAKGRPLCSPSRGWGVVDLAYGGSALGALVWMRTAGEDLDHETEQATIRSYNTGILITGLLAALYGSSAITGFIWAGTCRDQIDRFEAGDTVFAAPPTPARPAAAAPEAAAPRACFVVTIDGQEREQCAADIVACEDTRAAFARQRPDAATSACRVGAGAVQP